MEPTQRHILLVEDEAIIGLAEKTMLEGHSYRVTVAGSAAKALAAIEREPDIALVLMDIDLGSGPDGTELAQEILSQKELPIVFLTSHSERSMVEKVKGITRYGYVLKNGGEFVLVEAVTMAFELFDAHAELRRRNDYIQTVVDNLPIGLAVNFIEEGRADYMNHKFQEIYGWPAEVITDIEAFFQHVYPDPEYRRQIQQRIMDDIASDDPERMVWEEIEIVRAGGATALVTATNIPLPEQDLMVSTVQDVTDRVRANERYRDAVDRMRDGFVIIDADGRMHDPNPAVCMILGYSASELEGMSISELDPGNLPGQITDLLSSVAQAGPSSWETSVRSADGRLVPVAVEVNVIRSMPEAFVCIVRELSDA
jgi:PAS domain S-box-containing protein